MDCDAAWPGLGAFEPSNESIPGSIVSVAVFIPSIGPVRERRIQRDCSYHCGLGPHNLGHRRRIRRPGRMASILRAAAPVFPSRRSDRRTWGNSCSVHCLVVRQTKIGRHADI